MKTKNSQSIKIIFVWMGKKIFVENFVIGCIVDSIGVCEKDFGVCEKNFKKILCT